MGWPRPLSRSLIGPELMRPTKKECPPCGERIEKTVKCGHANTLAKATVHTIHKLYAHAIVSSGCLREPSIFGKPCRGCNPECFPSRCHFAIHRSGEQPCRNRISGS